MAAPTAGAHRGISRSVFSSASLAGRLKSPWIVWPFAAASLFVLVHWFALALKYAAAMPRYRDAFEAIGRALEDTRRYDIPEVVAAACALAFGFLFPRVRWRWFSVAERAIARFARHRVRALVLVGLLPLIIRLALIPVLAVPQPLVADEFGYLLLADTFASGRLTNPAHPLWRHFESIYVLHQPVYTSIYPIAPAVLLAIPKLLGANPWLGVWLGAGLMCALVCWMLQGWLPPKWALAGGLLAVIRFAIVSPWMNTFWGGAVAACGGALVLGAWPRLMRHRRTRDALLFGLGLAILAQSRPYEGLLLSMAPVVAIAIWLWKEKCLRVAAPLAAAGILIVAGTAYYNWRVTGNPLLMPYGLHQKLYGTPQSFYWQPPAPETAAVRRHKDIGDVFRWQLKAYRSFSWQSQAARVAAFWHFYLQPLLTFPLLFAFLRWGPRLRLVALAGLVLLAGGSLYPFFFPHYAAPLTCALILLAMVGMRRLRALRFRSRAVGRPAFRLLYVSIGVSALCAIVGGLLRPWNVTVETTPRSQALEQLRELGGEHLVLVRYSPKHSFHYGVVFNDADIDRSPVIWARALDTASNEELVRYYKDRDVWLFDPDEEPVTLVPYSGRPYLTVTAGGAGKRDDAVDGVSPGSIAVLFGGNFSHDLHGAAGTILGDLPIHLAATAPRDGDIFEPGREPGAADVPLSVDFSGVPARVLAVSNFGRESVTVLVPPELRAGPATVALRVGDNVSRRQVHILRAAPGIFQVRMRDGETRAILLHADGSLVDLDRPARGGETLRLFATGLGAHPIVVGVNHRGVRVLSAKPAASMPGVEEVVFEVPADCPSGAGVPLAIAAVVDGKAVYGNKSSLPVSRP